MCVPSQMAGQPDPMGLGKPYGRNVYMCTRYDIDADDESATLRELTGLIMKVKHDTLLLSLAQAVKALSAKTDGKSKFYAELLSNAP